MYSLANFASQSPLQVQPFKYSPTIFIAPEKAKPFRAKSTLAPLFSPTLAKSSQFFLNLSSSKI